MAGASGFCLSTPSPASTLASWQSSPSSLSSSPLWVVLMLVVMLILMMMLIMMMMLIHFQLNFHFPRWYSAWKHCQSSSTTKFSTLLPTGLKLRRTRSCLTSTSYFYICQNSPWIIYKSDKIHFWIRFGQNRNWPFLFSGARRDWSLFHSRDVVYHLVHIWTFSEIPRLPQ